MDNKSISFTNLNTGEVMPTDLTLSNDRHLQRGYKMYNIGIEYLVNNLSKKELLVTLNLYGSETVDYHNRLIGKFAKLTPDLDTAVRSRLKKKLIELKVLGEYNKSLMLNPFIFTPKGDKNIKNCQWLTQRAWKYLFEDKDSGVEELDEYIEHVFGS